MLSQKIENAQESSFRRIPDQGPGQVPGREPVKTPDTGFHRCDDFLRGRHYIVVGASGKHFFNFFHNRINHVPHPNGINIRIDEINLLSDNSTVVHADTGAHICMLCRGRFHDQPGTGDSFPYIVFSDKASP
jgi:hypothetical protein